MALTVQNLRAVGPGVEPSSLLPGQVCFNLADKILYVGDGSSVKTSFDGTQSPGKPGEGWFSMPMDFASLGDYYVANPAQYGDAPTDSQVLTWSGTLNHPIWTSGGDGGGKAYVTTNANVAVAPGSTTSEKISAAIGVVSPDEGDVTIVTGLPDDVYEGLYFFTTEWVKGAAYAYPSASEIIYDNTTSGLTPTVQGAIDDLNDGLVATTAIADAALPKAGGTMTGTLVSQDINIDTGFTLLFNGGVGGAIDGITDSTSFPSSTVAASAFSVKEAYDLADAALARSGGTMTGTITFAAGQVFPVTGIQDATLTEKGVVRIGANIQVTAGVISVASATVTGKGVVQLNNTLSSPATDQALTARAGKDLQDQINALTLASNVTLAGSLEATTGLLDSVTTQGAAAGFVAGAPLPAASAGNADYYVLVTVGGSYNPPGGGGPYNTEPGDWFLSDGASWQYLGVGSRSQSATYTTAGIVQLADTDATRTGTSDSLAVTPDSLQNKVSDSVTTTDSNLIASSTAVKAAYDIGAAAIPSSTITATGDILVGGAGGTPTALPVGNNGQVLIANSACSTGLEWVNDTPGDVSSVTGTLPIRVDNTNQQTPVVGVDAASTTAAGVVQLSDEVTSTSITEAATANAVKVAYDEAIYAQTIDPIASATVLFVNATTGSDVTGERGTAKPFATVSAALAAAINGDTIFVAPGTYTEDVTLNKGVNLAGTYVDQAIAGGPKIVGTFTVNVSGAGTTNWAVSNLELFAATAGTNAVVVTDNSFASGGIGTFTNCFFAQLTATDTTERCFFTSGTWTRSLYIRSCSFSGNLELTAGLVTGAQGYTVIDDYHGIASADNFLLAASGTVEIRNPSHAMKPILQTGGFLLVQNVNAWEGNSANTSTLFGGTGFAYKGTSAGFGQSVLYLAGQGNNVAEAADWAGIDIGTNVIYAFNNVVYDTSKAIFNGIPLTVASPNPAVVSSTMARPQWTYLVTPSTTVSAADQLGVILDSTTGDVHTTTTFDAGEY